MFSKTFFVCFFLTLHSEGLSMMCRWMDHKFGQHSESSLALLRVMGGSFTMDTTEVPFPDNLYTQASTASSAHQLDFMVQTLEEMAGLFEEDQQAVSWEESSVDDFLNVVAQQAEGLRSCMVSQKKSNKLHMYFKRLSHVLKRKGHSAEAWELIRKEIRMHLLKIDLLASSAFNTA
ncbi:interferon phi 4 [Centroberyx gerrardi]|uniref:interferon phi 4 n=1 Tax=Centroberyx gerrardi TaxID=166262 RepID=UPI003AABA98A